MHFSQIRFTDGRTFIDGPFEYSACIYLNTQPQVSSFYIHKRLGY